MLIPHALDSKFNIKPSCTEFQIQYTNPQGTEFQIEYISVNSLGQANIVQSHYLFLKVAWSLNIFSKQWDETLCLHSNELITSRIFTMFLILLLFLKHFMNISFLEKNPSTNALIQNGLSIKFRRQILFTFIFWYFINNEYLVRLKSAYKTNIHSIARRMN